MRHVRRWTVWTPLMLAAALVAAAGWAGAEDEKPAETPPDARKTFVERRTEQVLAPAPREDTGAQRIAVDVLKVAVEIGTEETLRTTAGPVPANPKVAPGLVRWHADLAAARAAARVSGKPVLVFQMLGNLDDEFC